MSYIYNTLAWILKCLKLYPSISLIDDSAAATQPLSRCARVVDAATQPLCQSGWSSHSATQPLCQSGRRSHSATQPLCRRGWRSSHSDTQPLSHSAGVAGGATQPLCQSGWSSHSATQSLCQSGWSSHSATQPLWVTEWLSGCVSHSARVAEWLMWKFPPLRVQSKDTNTKKKTALPGWHVWPPLISQPSQIVGKANLAVSTLGTQGSFFAPTLCCSSCL